METKINIAEILKDKPQGTKLYADAFGELSIVDIYTKDEIGINLLNRHRDELLFYSDGRYCIYGEPILFPSKEMRDWSKFAWKKGDVLVSNDRKREVLFKTWENDSYTKFVGFHCLITNDNEEVEYDNGTTVFNTNDFKGTEAEDAAQTYINTIEERLDGKLNLATLEVEKAQPEFKDGDIVVYGKSVAICRKIYKHTLYFRVSIDETSGLLFDDNCASSEGYRFATDSEKQQLFDALAKENKAWDTEKKEIVDLKPKWTPKPFDRVLVRNTDTEEWFPGFFEKFDSTWNNPYHIMNRRSMTDFAFKQCIPYEGNESLLGTTKDVEK